MIISELEKQIESKEIKEIALQFVDILGILHTLWVPSHLFPEVVEEGIHSDGSSLSRMVDVRHSDLKLMPDLSSFVTLPEGLFPQKTARVVCDIFKPESNDPFEMDTRFILKKAIKKAQDILGHSIHYYAASEIEFFLLFKDKDGNLKLIDEGGYLATPPADKGANLRIEIADALRNMGIVVEKHHHEVPHGKSEFNLQFDQALKMADTIYLIKFLIKLMANKKGLIGSFMPKPFHWEYGAGLHTHVSLFDVDKNENIFYDPNGQHSFSQPALHFLAGILTHSKALAAITNPTVNSYKRLVPGWEAPVNISWARYNRSVLVRVPPGKGKGTRFEYRPTDGSCNFYLAYASILNAGLDGIKRKLEPPQPIEENIYKMTEEERIQRNINVLPGTLGESLQELASDKFLQEGMGQALYEKYMELKLKEWKEFCTFVHEWERKKYLDV